MRWRSSPSRTSPTTPFLYLCSRGKGAYTVINNPLLQGSRGLHGKKQTPNPRTDEELVDALAFLPVPDQSNYPRTARLSESRHAEEPYTPHPQPSTLNPHPYTLDPHPYTLDPEPSPLHP